MLGGILKLTLSFSALFLFVILLWQSSIADALPVNILLLNTIYARIIFIVEKYDHSLKISFIVYEYNTTYFSFLLYDTDKMVFYLVCKTCQ